MTDVDEHLDALAHASDQDEVLVLKDPGVEMEIEGAGTVETDERTAYLGGGPDHFVSEVFDDSPGPARKTVDRSVAAKMVRSWEVDGFETVDTPEDYQPPEWVGEYETTTYRGPVLYPVPRDWELSIVEGDGIGWKRPEEPDPDSDYWEDHDSWSPEAEAWVTNEYEIDGGFKPDETVTKRFTIDGEDLFEVKDVHHDDLMQPVAELLARAADGEDLDVEAVDVPGAPVEEEPSPEEIAEENGSTLGDFAGDRDE